MLIIHDDKVARTISVLRQLAAGKVLTVPGGRRFAMAEDMSIGPIIEVNSENRVSGVSEMTLSAFHELLNRYDIGSTI